MKVYKMQVFQLDHIRMIWNVHHCVKHLSNPSETQIENHRHTARCGDAHSTGYDIQETSRNLQIVANRSLKALKKRKNRGEVG